MAALTAAIRAGSHGKSGKPWPKLIAFDSLASADMIVKMVVPTCGKREGKGAIAAECADGSVLSLK